jgi:hypothetical protein
VKVTVSVQTIWDESGVSNRAVGVEGELPSVRLVDMAQEGSSLVVPALAAGESPAGLLRAGQQLLLTRTSSASQGFWLELS